MLGFFLGTVYLLDRYTITKFKAMDLSNTNRSTRFTFQIAVGIYSVLKLYSMFYRNL